ncbi:MAG: hypothetical protein E6Q66_04630 [Pedobacter sp.]|nr:MAG: hypothetical protein E6Q66_04630 [Pedobacter sp.]
MIDATYITYFEQLARLHPALQHAPDEKQKTFFLIQNPFDLVEMDNAVRNNDCSRVLLLDVPTGYLSDNGSANYTQHTKIDFFLLGKAGLENIQAVRQDCFEIGLGLIQQLRADSISRKISARPIYLEEESIQYEPVGPIQASHYGYLFRLSLCSSFFWKSKF